MGKIEHLFRESMRTYNDYVNVGDLYAVCWVSYLLSIVDPEFTGKVEPSEKAIYRVKADNKYNAARKFLIQKYLESVREAQLEDKENCIKEIIDCTFKYGKMKCLESDPVLKDLSYDIETVIEGEYYSINEDDIRDETIVRTEAIMKNIDYGDALDHLIHPIMVDVYVEYHLYDVAVISLSHVPLGLGYGSLSGMR